MHIEQFINERVDQLMILINLIVSWWLIDLGPLRLDEEIYNARDPCTWLVHVLRLREYRLSDNYRRICWHTFNASRGCLDHLHSADASETRLLANLQGRSSPPSIHRNIYRIFYRILLNFTLYLHTLLDGPTPGTYGD